MRVWDLRELRDVVIPDGAEKIGNHWFLDTSIESVTIPASVKEIGVDAFRYCEQLKHVTFAEGSRLEKLRSSCFSYSGLEKITIPSSVTIMEDHAFCLCGDLKGVTFQDGSRLQKIDACCFEESGLEEFVTPLGLKEIGVRALASCKNLKRVVLNEGPAKLEDYCNHYIGDYFGTFQNSGIEEITLPSTLKWMNKYTFSSCSNLRTIYVKDGCQANLPRSSLPESV